MREDYLNELAELMPELWKYAVSLCKDYDNAGDLRSDTVFQVIRYVYNYDPTKGSFKNFCFVVMKNLFINQLHKQKESCCIEPFSHVMKADSTPEEDAQFSQMLSYLNPETRLYYEGYNYREIAMLCGFSSKATAKNRIDICANGLRQVFSIKAKQKKRIKMFEKINDRVNI